VKNKTHFNQTSAKLSVNKAMFKAKFIRMRDSTQILMDIVYTIFIYIQFCVGLNKMCTCVKHQS
jgi:hypothetical protein